MSNERLIDKYGHKQLSIFGLKADLYAILANFSTLSNFLLGLTVSLMILMNNPLQRELATRFIVLGASFDAIDGRLARRSNTKPRLGAQFDTAADQMSFAVAPGLMIVHMMIDSVGWFAFLAGLIYYFTASFRLSRFMIQPTSGYFVGMPSPVSALFIAAWYVQPDISIPFLVATTIFISVLMISNLPYTAMKTVNSPAQKIYFVFTISMMLLLTYSPDSWMEILGKIWITYIIYFSILGPLHAWHNMRLEKENKTQKNIEDK